MYPAARRSAAVERRQHLLENGASECFVVFEAELPDYPAHGASVEQAECHGFRQKRVASGVPWMENGYPTAGLGNRGYLGSHRDSSGAGTVDVFTKPQLQHQQRPQALRVIGSTCAVRVPDSAHRRVLEDPSSRQPPVEEQFVPK